MLESEKDSIPIYSHTAPKAMTGQLTNLAQTLWIDKHSQCWRGKPETHMLHDHTFNSFDLIYVNTER